VWSQRDVWGYCQGQGGPGIARPVIVISAQRQVARGSRTVRTAGGVLLLTGSRTGIHIVYKPQVKPGELPGPAYPYSLTDQQREQTAWAAGRKWRARAQFGYEPTIDQIQGGHTSDFLLRGPDRRLYFVTPLTPRASNSQAFIAYAVTPADEVTDQRLNRLDVFVLPDGDSRVANLNTLTNTATDAARATDPTFLNTGGTLEEFTPLGGDMWRVYAVRRSLTEFYIDVSTTGRVQPTTVQVKGNGTAPSTNADGRQTVCSTSPAQMTARQLTDCMASLVDEMRRRNAGT
jgi:hypothetical protein